MIDLESVNVRFRMAHQGHRRAVEVGRWDEGSFQAVLNSIADIPSLHDELKWLRERAERMPGFDPYHDTDGKVELPPGVSVDFRNIVIDFSHSLNIMPSLTSTGYVITCNDCEGYRKEVARL